MKQQTSILRLALGIVAAALLIETVACVITVQIGGATRLSSLSRTRDRYSCYWDCDLVGCQIARDDDECAYDCEKICRVRYDYAASARSGVEGASAAAAGAASETGNDALAPKTAAAAAADQLSGKSGVASPAEQPAMAEEIANNGELVGAGTSVRLHLPRNASARNFAIWERCAQDAGTGKLTEKPFNL